MAGRFAVALRCLTRLERLAISRGVAVAGRTAILNAAREALPRLRELLLPEWDMSCNCWAPLRRALQEGAWPLLEVRWGRMRGLCRG